MQRDNTKTLINVIHDKIYLLNAIWLTPGGKSTVQYSTVQYSTVQHSHTNNTQKNTMKQNTQNKTYIKINVNT